MKDIASFIKRPYQILLVNTILILFAENYKRILNQKDARHSIPDVRLSKGGADNAVELGQIEVPIVYFKVSNK